jgi:geranylgeranyl diphosphate synthase type II
MTDRQFERRCNGLRRLIDSRLAAMVGGKGPKDLCAASRYVLRAPGKRIRPILLLLSCEAVGGSIGNALDAATALEMLHNFTLVHDDVMDNAASRRGRPTVHTRWNVNNAILVGDTILGLAYRSLLRSGTPQLPRAVRLFSEGFIAVCEGQAYDLEFERRSSIGVPGYFMMIDKKTGALVATATELGGLLGDGTPAQVRALREFGRHIGRAFQVQDDLLDVIADEKDLGKKIGADITEGKRTFLLISAWKRARGRDRSLLQEIMSRTRGRNRHGLVGKVKSLYARTGVIDEARTCIKRETEAGLRVLASLPPNNARETLGWLAGRLVHRTS